MIIISVLLRRRLRNSVVTSNSVVRRNNPPMNRNNGANGGYFVCPASSRIVCPHRQGTYKLQTPDDGSYIQLSLSDGMVRGGETRVRAFVCNVCTHHAFFAPGYPKDGKTKGWRVPKRPDVPGGTGRTY
jgi:hypothetical protein